MINKEILFKELIKNGHSKENGSKVWSIANRSFRYINLEMTKAFLKIREHPRYKATITNAEIKLLRDNISRFLDSVKESQFNLIDMNCIRGEKAVEIMKTLPKTMKLRYCPVSVNEDLIKMTLENLKKQKYENLIDYAPRITKDFESFDQVGAALRNTTYQKNVYLLLSSLISSFEINDYLFRLSQPMFPGDLLVIGNGIRTGERFVHLEVYKNPMFNNWLIHLMRQLGFKDEEVSYDARFANNRLEAYYTINVDKTIESEGKKINFKKGDKIIVAFQYKLYEEELKNFCKMYFETVELVKDPEGEYALVLCKK